MIGFEGAVSIKNMENSKGNRGLLDQKRFEPLRAERKRRLENLTMAEAIALTESFMSSELVWEWRDNFAKDNPVDLKRGLRGMRRR